MDYEQKYKEALERAKDILSYKEVRQEDMEYLFPELAESEDERIRKEFCEDIWTFIPNEKAHKYIAWLEKQGEQKLIMNVPPREVILSIWDLGNEWKELTKGSISTEYGTQLNYIQKHWHESEYYLREKQGEQKLANSAKTCKKSQRMVSAEAKEALYDKPAWSEEDVAMLDSAIAFVEHSAFTTIGKGKGGVVAWLKCLKERYTWKPSDEQMLAINTAINVLGKGTINGKYLIELQEQLKKLMEEDV